MLHRAPPQKKQEIKEYCLNQVVNKKTSEVDKMIVREYKRIGEGAFGTVVEAVLKKCSANEKAEEQQENPWLGPFAIKRVPAQTEYKSRELEILRLVDHPNIVGLRYYFDRISSADGKVYQNLVMECLSSDLQFEIRYYRRSKYTIPYPHMKVYTFQLARAMLYLHAFRIAHRDIKPSNILIDPVNIQLKVCDFGSAKRLEQNQPSVSYICSRFYRAPELIVGCPIYSTQIDIWGLGCIIAEMFLGKPIFQGETPESQLKEISKLLGPPSKTFLFNNNPHYRGNIYSTKLFSCSVEEQFRQVFSNSPTEAIDLLMRILVYEPELRASPRRILSHPFFNEIRREDFSVYSRASSEPKKINLLDFSDFELNLMGSLKNEILGLS